MDRRIRRRRHGQSRELERDKRAALASVLSPQEFEEALTRRPNFAQAWYDLGAVSRKLKDKKGAERAFRKYLELAPDGTFAGEVREYLH